VDNLFPGAIPDAFIWGAVLTVSLTATGAATHETAAVFFVGIAAIAMMRMRSTSGIERLTQLAISVAAVWSACYLISVILYPREAANRADFLNAVFALAFIKQNGRINFAAVVSIISCVSVFWIACAQHKAERTQSGVLTATISFFILAAAVFLLWPGWTIAPAAQFSGRGLPVLGTAVLSFGLWAGWRCGIKPEFLLSKPALLVLCGLLVTQSVAQIVMTRHWTDTLGTVTRIIEQREGRVSWQTALETAAPRDPILWQEMTWYSEIQAMSLLLAPKGRVHALIDAPPSESWKPFQLDAPTSLPKSRFWDYAAYANGREGRNLVDHQGIISDR
jgi:hypothetical protein